MHILLYRVKLCQFQRKFLELVKYNLENFIQFNNAPSLSSGISNQLLFIGIGLFINSKSHLVLKKVQISVYKV